MNTANLETISKTVMVLVLGSLFFYLIYSMADFGDGNSERQVASIEKIIDKALVQCYAFEGDYPSNIERIEKYGVIFDNDKYIYHYEWFGGNIKPNIIVIEK